MRLPATAEVLDTSPIINVLLRFVVLCILLAKLLYKTFGTGM